MIPIEGQPILTAAAMRAAEQRAVAAGISLATLMERAGQGVAAAVRRLAGGDEALLLCGTGNNGGDGWVAAATLAAWGHPVRVAASGEPGTDLARAARARWTGPVEAMDEARPGKVCVDALFGTGLSRPLEPATGRRLARLLAAARYRIAIDLPSGLGGDGGEVPDDYAVTVDLTLALGALKPAHVLYPAADRCGAVRLLDIGLGEPATAEVTPDRSIGRPAIGSPTASDHKYSRGLVVVIGGTMPGAGALAAEAALHAGAGYALLLADRECGSPHALVRRGWAPDALATALAGKSEAHSAVVVGPGLGRDAEAAAKLDAALASDCPLVIDGDALRLLDAVRLRRLAARPPHRRAVLTPHAGEFAAVFGAWSGNKIDAAREAARRAGATVVFKGPDTVVAHPDGRTRTMARAERWLSTAGTGDVLAGAIAAMLTAGVADPVEAAVWLHVEAAHRARGPFLADDLARALASARRAL